MPPADPNSPMRHALVQLRPEASWVAVAPEFRPRLTTWFAAGWPAVVARLQGDEPTGHWRLGVPLPPEEGKLRLALTVAPSNIGNWRQALHLREVLATAPSCWIAPVQSLLERTRILELEPRVYGSFAWQALTGLSYVTADSDLDLVWKPSSVEQAEALFVVLQDWEDSTGLRADGEILLPNDSAICWRELAGQSSSVLVKTLDTVSLQSRQTVLDALEATASHLNEPLSATS